jgi:hypothetical protein
MGYDFTTYCFNVRRRCHYVDLAAWRLLAFGLFTQSDILCCTTKNRIKSKTTVGSILILLYDTTYYVSEFVPYGIWCLVMSCCNAQIHVSCKQTFKDDSCRTKVVAVELNSSSVWSNFCPNFWPNFGFLSENRPKYGDLLYNTFTQRIFWEKLDIFWLKSNLNLLLL